ncbi:MAG: DUF2059 domain-containing protein [Gammaproteobacteria bacterium]|nr:DUF2059 domain-containing protein [Gammaproteobacteria bacterium]
MKNLLSIILLATLSLGVSADPQTHRQAAERLLEVSDADRMIERIKPQLDMLNEQMLAQLEVPAGAQPIVDEHMDKVRALMAEMMNWDVLREQFIDVYIRVFDEQELLDLVAFYESPVGRKVVEKMPAVMEESMAITQRQLGDLMPRVQAIMQEMGEKLRAQQAAQGG